MMSPDRSSSKTRSVLCVVGLVAALVAILALASALAIRLLELGDPQDQSSFPFNLFQFGPSDEALEANRRMRTSLWTLALVNLFLTGASAVFALVVNRTNSRVLSILFVLLGAGSCGASFLLAWPLGIITAVIPASAIPVLFLTTGKPR